MSSIMCLSQEGYIAMVTQRPFNDHFLATFSEQDQLKDAAVVAEWLNAATGSESYVRVSTLLDEIRQVGAAMDRADKEGWYLPTRTSPLSKVVCDQLNDLRRRHVVIHQSLARYSYWPTLSRVVGEKRWLLSLSSAPELDEF